MSRPGIVAAVVSVIAAGAQPFVFGPSRAHHPYGNAARALDTYMDAPTLDNKAIWDRERARMHRRWAIEESVVNGIGAVIVMVVAAIALRTRRPTTIDPGRW